MKNSCRYTEMAHVFKFGTTNQQNFSFGGLSNFITQAKAAQKAIDTTDFTATAFTDLQTGLKTYLTSYTTLKTVFDQVYFSPSNNQFTTIRDPLDGSPDVISYLKTWGNLSEEAVSTGLWNSVTQEFVRGPRKANFVYTNLARYLSPMICRILYLTAAQNSNKSATALYSQLTKYIAALEELSASLDALYLQISSSFVSGLKSAFGANLVMFVMIGYGCLAVFVLVAAFFEVMFFRKRDQKIYRTLTNVFWCLFGPGAVVFSVFLAILAPLTAAGTEYYAMLEPALLNRTFYGKLEYPNDKIKAGLFPCTHGDGKFHTSGLPYGNPIIQFTDMVDFLNVTMSIDSNLNALTSKFTDVTSKMNIFEKFQEDFYVPPSTSNQNRKISVMLKVLNAYTNKDTPYTFNNIAISQDVVSYSISQTVVQEHGRTMFG